MDTQLTFLHTLYEEDKNLVASLIEQFRKQSSEFILDMRTNLKQDDYANLKITAHTFKGMCLNLGFQTVGNLLKELELCAHTEHGSHSSDKLEHIQIEINQLLMALQHFDGGR